MRVQRGGARPDGEGFELARWAARQLRFGLDMGEPGVVRAVRELVRLLDGDGLGVGRGEPIDDGFGVGFRPSSRFDARQLFDAAFGSSQPTLRRSY